MLTGSLDRLAMRNSLLVWPFFGTARFAVPKLKQWKLAWPSAALLVRASDRRFLV